eukprot:TRINITY_DN7462_c3_g1_i1.p1 TRINITY_DN7462_c3_g1~~TRINITY_DN7462_c3_g1_i1.p1  ORF type:complete len:339 (-),score=50.66 TRINITY_DN7462_c3_g1_i1:376-1323(-)
MEAEILKGLGCVRGSKEFKQAVRLAQQYSRTIRSSQLKSEPIEHSFVCLELALEHLNLEVNKEPLFKRSGTTRKLYCETRRNYRAKLGLKELGHSLDQIVIKNAPTASRNLVRKVENLKQVFEQRFLSRLSSEKRSCVDFSKPVFNIVAFWLSAKQEKIKVSKSELIAQHDITQQYFEDIRKQMQELCADILQSPKDNSARKRKAANANGINGTPKPTKKRRIQKVSEEEQEEDDEEGGGDDENLPQHCINKKALREKRFEQWKEDAIQASLKHKREAQKQSGNKKKQALITRFFKGTEETDPIEDETDNDANEN